MEGCPLNKGPATIVKVFLEARYFWYQWFHDSLAVKKLHLVLPEVYLFGNGVVNMSFGTNSNLDCTRFDASTYT